MNLFRIRGIRLQLHFTFLLLVAYAAYEGWVEGQWAGMFWSVVVLLAFFTCVVLHELGHSFTAMHFGIGVRRILLMPIGGMAEFEDIPRQPIREFLITVAGPAVNFVIAGMLWVPLLGATPATIEANRVLEVADLVLQLNLVMGCFNLLPAFPMDGGRILRALFATRLPYLRATFWAATIGKVIAALAVIGALTGRWWHLADSPIHLVARLARWLHLSESPFPMVAVLFSFIFIAGEIEYRVVKRRERDDAHWRVSLARLHAPIPPPPPDGEPPVLAS
ncbi:MAG: site-2 protease family protein [Verrucomicrobia bacterium]|nr:site-2 protease family protein [Verrucomicrobiota bacterium]